MQWYFWLFFQLDELKDADLYKSKSDCYDPSFLLPLLSHLLAPGNKTLPIVCGIVLASRLLLVVDKKRAAVADWKVLYLVGVTTCFTITVLSLSLACRRGYSCHCLITLLHNDSTLPGDGGFFHSNILLFGYFVCCDIIIESPLWVVI